VVEGASSVVVTLNDMTEFEGEIIATDPNTDLAVIRIRSRDSLPTLRFADSDNVRIGQWVLAVGNPFNLTSTVTAGIISAKARNIGVLRNQLRQGMGAEYAIESFIQTDAAVNPGNSGGALVTLDGELIGINTAIATENGSYQGYSFAIPANLVKKIALDLIQYGVVQRGFIGVSIRDIDSGIANRRNLASRLGAYVTDLSPTGAAREAGIEVGDVIVSVNGKSIRNSSELQEQIGHYRPGDVVAIRLTRNGMSMELNVKLRNKQGTTELLPGRRNHAGNADPTQNRGAQHPALGVVIRPLDSQSKQRLALKGGIVLHRIEEGSPFQKVGVPEGFIVTHINRAEISSPDDFHQFVQRNRGIVQVVGVKPNGRSASYVVNLGGE
jgi:S1-C subfamily serine protease